MMGAWAPLPASGDGLAFTSSVSVGGFKEGRPHCAAGPEVASPPMRPVAHSLEATTPRGEADVRPGGPHVLQTPLQASPNRLRTTWGPSRSGPSR